MRGRLTWQFSAPKQAELHADVLKEKNKLVYLIFDS